jgi:hypothetical protein
MFFRAASALAAAGILAGGAQAEQKETVLQDGAYEVRARLELPNVQSWSASTTTATICVPYAGGANGAPFPVLSGNNPLATCPARNVRRDGATLSFEIVCDGRGAAWARAVYKLMPSEFEGRIAMVMGGKNMTMTEVQTGRRVGPCPPAAAPQNCFVLLWRLRARLPSHALRRAPAANKGILGAYEPCARVCCDAA